LSDAEDFEEYNERMLQELAEHDTLCSSVLKAVEGLSEDKAIGILSNSILAFAGPNKDILRAVIHDLSYVIGEVDEPRKKWINPDGGFTKYEKLA
jgi:hypothetical protein